MPMASSSKIVIAGSARVGTKTLVRALLEASGDGEITDSLDVTWKMERMVEPPPEEGEGETENIADPAEAGVEEIDWLLVTKYYSAPLKLWRRRTLPLPPAMEAYSPDLLAAIQETEGLILMMDLSRPESFHELHTWGPFADSLGDKVVLRLLVATKLDMIEDSPPPPPAPVAAAPAAPAPLSSQADRRTYLEWCIDHGFEYVEADCTTPARGGESREKEGIPRVIEALQSTMWSSMEYKTPARPQQGIASAAAQIQQDFLEGSAGGAEGEGDDSAQGTDDEEEDEEDDQDAMLGYSNLRDGGSDDEGDGDEDDGAERGGGGGGGGEALGGWGSPPQFEAAANVGDEGVKEGTESTVMMEGTFDPFSDAEESGGGEQDLITHMKALWGSRGEGNNSNDDEDDDAAAAQEERELERLMAEVKEVRDLGSHEERRERAAATALKLLKLMGAEGDDEQQEDSDSC